MTPSTMTVTGPRSLFAARMDAPLVADDNLFAAGDLIQRTASLMCAGTSITPRTHWTGDAGPWAWSFDNDTLYWTTGSPVTGRPWTMREAMCLTAHETGHGLMTGGILPYRGAQSPRVSWHGLTNGAEDVRMERRIAARWPGFALHRPGMIHTAIAGRFAAWRDGQVDAEADGRIVLSLMALTGLDWSSWSLDNLPTGDDGVDVDLLAAVLPDWRRAVAAPTSRAMYPFLSDVYAALVAALTPPRPQDPPPGDGPAPDDPEDDPDGDVEDPPPGGDPGPVDGPEDPEDDPEDGPQDPPPPGGDGVPVDDPGDADPDGDVDPEDDPEDADGDQSGGGGGDGRDEQADPDADQWRDPDGDMDDPDADMDRDMEDGERRPVDTHPRDHGRGIDPHDESGSRTRAEAAAVDGKTEDWGQYGGWEDERASVRLWLGDATHAPVRPANPLKGVRPHPFDVDPRQSRVRNPLRRALATVIRDTSRSLRDVLDENGRGGVARNRRRGRLDGRRAHRIVRGDDRLFRSRTLPEGITDWGIYLCGDVSGSMRRHDRLALAAAMVAIHDAVRSIDGVDVGVGLYGSGLQAAWPIGQVDVVDMVTHIYGTSGGTDESSALFGARAALHASGRRGRIVVVMTDGAPNNAQEAAAIARALAAEGIVTLGIGINHASPTYHPHHASVRNVANLPRVVSGAIAHIIGGGAPGDHTNL